MESERIREAIIEQREEMEDIFKKEKIVGREARRAAAPLLKHPNILAVLGVRRCGKSVFSFQIFSGGKFGYVNFDDERLLGVTVEDLNKILQVFYELYGNDIENIILDEPQNVPGWELFASRLRRTKKVVITGSNSQLLAGELATHLTGRHVDILIHPFSLRELLEYRGVAPEFNTTMQRAEITRVLREYLVGGGFPEFFKFGKAILRRIYEDIITKDVVKRRKVKMEEELRKVARFLISNFSREFTYSSLKNVTRVKHPITISKWVGYLEEAYLLHRLERFSFKLKEATVAPKKIYCVDNGLINAVGLRPGEDLGRQMENLTAVELLRRKSCWHNDWEIFYWKDHQGREVDFVVKEGPEVKQLIQVTYASGRDEIDRREMAGLVKASDLLKCKDLLTITWDYEDELNSGGEKINFLPMWKWLLGKPLGPAA